MAETTQEALLAYLREHGRRYSLPALWNTLRSQGYEPGEIEEAMATYQAENGITAPADVSAGTPVGCTAFLLGLPMVVVNGFLGALILEATQGSSHALTLWLALLASEVGIGLWIAQSPGGRGFGAGLIVGAVLAGGLVLLLIGVCSNVMRGL